MLAPVLRFALTVLLLMPTAIAQTPAADAALVARLEEQFTAIERILQTLRHVSVTTELAGTRLTSEAWFVPGDSVETPVKVILSEARGEERREMAFWLDQGHLFLVQEQIANGSERKESRRHYDGPRLAQLQTRVTAVPPDQPNNAGFTPSELPADAEHEGLTLEEIALETASQLSPVTVTNRPVRWE
jgi:hypothetical protein